MNTTTNYKETLENDGVLVQFPTGYSMLPMLRQKKDTVVIKRINRKPKENPSANLRRADRIRIRPRPPDYRISCF